MLESDTKTSGGHGFIRISPFFYLLFSSALLVIQIVLYLLCSQTAYSLLGIAPVSVSMFLITGWLSLHFLISAPERISALLAVLGKAELGQKILLFCIQISRKISPALALSKELALASYYFNLGKLASAADAYEACLVELTAKRPFEKFVVELFSASSLSIAGRLLPAQISAARVSSKAVGLAGLLAIMRQLVSVFLLVLAFYLFSFHTIESERWYLATEKQDIEAVKEVTESKVEFCLKVLHSPLAAGKEYARLTFSSWLPPDLRISAGRKAIAYLRQAYERDYMEEISVLNNMADISLMHDDFAAARTFYTETIDSILEDQARSAQSFFKDDERQSWATREKTEALYGLARSLQELGELDSAQKYFEETVHLSASDLWTGTEEYLESRCRLAELLLKQGQVKRAEQLTGEAADSAEKRYRLALEHRPAVEEYRKLQDLLKMHLECYRRLAEPKAAAKVEKRIAELEAERKSAQNISVEDQEMIVEYARKVSKALLDLKLKTVDEKKSRLELKSLLGADPASRLKADFPEKTYSAGNLAYRPDYQFKEFAVKKLEGGKIRVSVFVRIGQQSQSPEQAYGVILILQKLDGRINAENYQVLAMKPEL